MTPIIPHRKEKPLTSLASLGGGATGLQFGGGAKEKLYIEDLFSTFLHTGNNSYPRQINNGIDLAKHGGLVWQKNRTLSYGHQLIDSVRGVSKVFESSSSSPEDNGNYAKFSSFNSNGFTMTSPNTGVDTQNSNGRDHVTWTFRQAPKFFAISEWVGNGQSNRQISHQLDSAPGMIIIKNRNNTNSWIVGHQYVTDHNPWNSRLILNSTNGSGVYSGPFSNTAPTSSVFTIGSDDEVNRNGDNFIAYLWGDGEQAFGEDEEQKVVKCGSYYGSGAEQTIDIGFEAGFVMIKRADANGEDWYVADQLRGLHLTNDTNQTSPDAQMLRWSSTHAESNNQYVLMDPKGFRVTGHPETGYSGGRYIYLAIAYPAGLNSKPAEVGTDVFHMAYGNSAGTNPSYVSNFPVDFALSRRPASGEAWYTLGRNSASNYVMTNQSSSETYSSNFVFDHNNGWRDGSAISNYMSWMWKNSQGFECTGYVGNGSGTGALQPHSMGRSPEMIWLKRRGSGADWLIGHESKGFGWANNFNSNGFNSISAETSYWVANTDTYRGIGMSDQRCNQNGKSYLVMLFASVESISKCGGYTGNGSSSNAINCGFQPRFVIIKRTDSSGDWKVWDSLRSTNMLRLNTSNSQVNDNLISFTSTGFTLISPDGTVNANSGSYIFYAHA